MHFSESEMDEAPWIYIDTMTYLRTTFLGRAIAQSLLSARHCGRLVGSRIVCYCSVDLQASMRRGSTHFEAISFFTNTLVLLFIILAVGGLRIIRTCVSFIFRVNIFDAMLCYSIQKIQNTVEQYTTTKSIVFIDIKTKL